MKLKSVLFFAAIACLPVVNYAQALENKTLLTIDGTDYDAGTFMKVYLKNLDIVQDESQKNLDNYLQLYIDYRLKLKQAYEMGLQNGEEYQQELQNYRASLAESYLTDNEVTDALVQEAYRRMNEEVNVSHIIINARRTASPQDTLKAYERLLKIKERIDGGEDFAAVARKESEGPSASSSGELGWFGPFKMVYDFEEVAYQTEEGEVSDIFRTDFGYHILKINSKRKTPNDVTVAHIMTYDQREDSTASAKQRIDQVYEQLQAGQDFAAMAREFSEDINTSRNGGKLPRFGTGGLGAPEFEQAAFNIEKVGDYTQPVRARSSWHIIQLLERHPIPSFAEAEASLKDQIKKSPRSRTITEAFTNKLLKKYGVKVDRIEDYVKAFPAFTDSLMTGNWEMPAKIKQRDLFMIQDQNYSSVDFYGFAQTKQVKDFEQFATLEQKIESYYKDFLQESLINYYDEHLERDNEDFAFIYREYKEGLLLFDLMERKIWDAAKADSVGQLNYYNKNKDQYNWKRRLDIVLTQSTDERTAQKVQELLKNGKTIDEIKKQINKDGSTKVMISNGVVEENFSRLPRDFDVKQGVSKVYEKENNGFYKVIRVNEILEPTTKTFQEARGKVVNDYQQQLEKEWMNSLREGRTIKINDKVLNQVKKEIEKKRA